MAWPGRKNRTRGINGEGHRNRRFLLSRERSEGFGQVVQRSLGRVACPERRGRRAVASRGGTNCVSPSKETTDYFGDMSKVWMLNFRVRNMDAMVAQLKGAGITVGEVQDYPPVGRFTRIHDPEGNPIELWEPGK